jgi:hypothetical protein
VGDGGKQHGEDGDQAAHPAQPERWLPPFLRPGVRFVGAIGSDASEEQIAAFVERLNAQSDASRTERARRERGQA